MEKYDLIIVGAGPAGIFTAVELLRRGSKKHILLVEKGKPVEKRHCPKAEIGHCVNAVPPAPSPPASPVRAPSPTAS